MARGNVLVPVLSDTDKTNQAIAILSATTSSNAPQQLDKLARLFLGDHYPQWVSQYRQQYGEDWLGEYESRLNE